MPNWCNTTIKVSGGSEAVKKFIDLHTVKNIVYLYTIHEFLSQHKNQEFLDLHTINEFLKSHTVEEEFKFSFNTLIPVPDDYENENEKYVNWCVEHWGTKWDIDSSDYYIEKDSVTVTGLTAWSPPAEWCKTVAKQFPKLQIELLYYEPGMAFYGRSVYSGDSIDDESYEITDDDYVDIENDPEPAGEFKKFLDTYGMAY